MYFYVYIWLHTSLDIFTYEEKQRERYRRKVSVCNYINHTRLRSPKRTQTIEREKKKDEKSTSYSDLIFVCSTTIRTYFFDV